MHWDIVQSYTIYNVNFVGCWTSVELHFHWNYSIISDWKLFQTVDRFNTNVCMLPVRIEGETKLWDSL